jgi:hypothetical protein
MFLLVRIYISGNVSHGHLQILSLFSAAMAELTRLTLTNIPFELQITICVFLRPIDILALRKVCHQSILVAQVTDELERSVNI